MMEEIWKNDGERKGRLLCLIEHPAGLSCRGYDWILCPVLEVTKMRSIQHLNEKSREIPSLYKKNLQITVALCTALLYSIEI